MDLALSFDTKRDGCARLAVGNRCSGHTADEFWSHTADIMR